MADEHDDEDWTHQLSRILARGSDDVYDAHHFNIDLKANHIYLMGEETAESEDYGVEPGVEYKMANTFIRNLNMLIRKNSKPILIHMKTCFSGKTPVLTAEGPRPIKDIAIGDRVLTHTGVYKPVTDVMSQMYDGEMVRLYYGRSRHNGTSITATKDHPIWVERDGVRIWLPMAEIIDGDVIFVEAGQCEKTGEPVPYWKRVKNFDAGRLKRKGSLRKADKDILRACRDLQAQGWRVVPTDTNVRPDIVGFKDGRVVVFEVENAVGKSLEVKQQKYENAPILDFVDDVVWFTEEHKHSYSWYEADTESPFIKVKVTGTERWKNKYRQRVYNLTVEDDNSYVANRVVVHNCGGDWGEGMAIYDAIKACPNKVTILSYTHARSMSSLIFLAADKKVMMPNSIFMFHHGESGYVGTFTQAQAQAKFDKEICDPTMIDIYVDAMHRKAKGMTRWSKDKLREYVVDRMAHEEDVYLTAQEAVDHGFCDEIFGAGGKYDWDGLLKFND